MPIVRRQRRVRGVNGRMVTRESFGFSVVVNGELIRRSDASWTRADAERALAEARLGAKPKPKCVTFAELADRYVTYKSRKRSIDQDR